MTPLPWSSPTALISISGFRLIVWTQQLTTAISDPAQILMWPELDNKYQVSNSRLVLDWDMAHAVRRSIHFFNRTSCVRFQYHHFISHKNSSCGSHILSFRHRKCYLSLPDFYLRTPHILFNLPQTITTHPERCNLCVNLDWISCDVISMDQMPPYSVIFAIPMGTILETCGVEQGSSITPLHGCAWLVRSMGHGGRDSPWVSA